jgi:hypothetical protein
MFKYQTAIDTTKQVYDPSPGQRALAAAPPGQFKSPAANQHFQNMYRAQGQKAAVELGRAAQQSQNNYYMASQRAQDQSVLGGLNLLSDQQANAAQRQSEADAMKYRFVNSFLTGPNGLLGGLL